MDDEYKDYTPIDAPLNENELFIESLCLKLNGDYNDYLKINGKVLHSTNKLNLSFDILLYDDTEINPFEEEIKLNIEFIENERPYIQILSNFLRPTMYDIKNYYFCLSSKLKYIFKSTDLANCQLILEEIMSNIGYFINHIKDCESFKIFIYFGEYEINHIYHINDFLRNSQRIEFFRINQIKNDKFYDKLLYIVCTEIYFILFEPIEDNKSLAKILFYKKLSDIEFNFEEIGFCYDKKEVKKRLKIIVNENKNRKLLKEKDEEIKTNNKITIRQLSSINNNINSNFNISANSESFKAFRESVLNNGTIKKKRNSLINISETNNNVQLKPKNIINLDDDNIFNKNKFEFLFYDKNEEDDNDILILQNQYIFFKRIIAKKGVLDDIKYNSIISLSRLIFTHPVNEKKLSLHKLRVNIDRLIEYNEKLYEKHKNMKRNNDKQIIKNCIENIIYLCTKISGALFNDDKINYYLDKMKLYTSKNEYILK